ncbi:hypothetical protein AHiyo8_04910 [Arthrobacter sp. Hiyo8]|nr:hypothetical protein AHiyo8_04910 [Arthrobacter sp. Hiyo8]
MPMSAREMSSTPRLGASTPTTPASRRIATPERNTRLGPKRTESFPMVGWATALHRYRTEMSPAVAPGLDRKSAPMPTSAVAIIELLIGFRVEPSSSGAVNLQPSGFDGGFRGLQPERRPRSVGSQPSAARVS